MTRQLASTALRLQHDHTSKQCYDDSRFDRRYGRRHTWRMPEEIEIRRGSMISRLTISKLLRRCPDSPYGGEPGLICIDDAIPEYRIKRCRNT